MVSKKQKPKNKKKKNPKAASKRSRGENRENIKKRKKQQRDNLISKRAIKQYADVYKFDTNSGRPRVSDLYVLKLNQLFVQWIRDMADVTSKIVQREKRKTVYLKDLIEAFPNDIAVQYNLFQHRSIPRFKVRKWFLNQMPVKTRMGKEAENGLRAMVEYCLHDIVNKTVNTTLKWNRKTLIARDLYDAHALCKVGTSVGASLIKAPYALWSHVSMGKKKLQKEELPKKKRGQKTKAPPLKQEEPSSAEDSGEDEPEGEEEEEGFGPSGKDYSDSE
jgi:histone H3/H4